MGNILAKKSKPSSQDRAILDLKIQRDKLQQYQRKLETVLAREVEIARDSLKANNKRKALIALKKKKYQQSLLEKTDAQLLTLEQLTSSVEYALVEAQVMQGLKAGNAVLQEIHKEMSIEAVERLMQDTADAIAYQNEIDEMLGSKMSAEDEADILAELDAIEKEQTTVVEPTMPSVPTTEPNKPISEDEAIEEVDGETHTSIRSKSKEEKSKTKEPALVAA